MEIKKEMPFISVITPNYNDSKTLGQMIDSIFDQDYPNIEMIVVDDGSTDGSKKLLQKKEKQYKNLKVIFLRHKGACAARNVGAKEAKGKYLSFLPADSVLYPGVLRTWINHLESNPDFDFLYGGYRFVDEETRRPMMNYMSEPFDPYFLKIQNYIDGSFPLKKELFDKMGGWDVGIKSLQDWDFWLNAVLNHNAKGFYLPEIFFETTIPHAGGLSDDSHKNWIERTTQIKNKYGIKTSAICVSSKGAEYHGKQVAKLLNADYKFSPEFKPHNYEMIYLLGFYPSIADQCGKIFENHGGLRVIHWIGGDIYQLQQMDTIHKKMLVDWIKNNADVCLTECENTRKELEAEGIRSEILPIPPKKFFPITPLPKKFTIAVYSPQNNKGYYYPELMDEVAKKCRNVEFKFFGDITQTGRKGNIEYFGRLNEAEMEKVIEGSSCLLRILPHDGLSISVEEFLTAGRRVITNIQNIKGTFNVLPDLDSIVKVIEEVKKFTEPDKKTAEYWLKELDHKKYKAFFEKLLSYDPKKYWETRANSWNEIQGEVTFDTKEVIEEIKKLNPKSLLDIGCGNGNWAKVISQEFGKRFNYFGVDVSSKMIKFAQKVNPKMKFRQLDVRELGKLKRKFDLIFAYTCLLHIPPADMAKTITELKKIGKRIMFIEPTQNVVCGIQRYIHSSAIREFEKGNILFHPRSTNIHPYEELFKIKKTVKLGERTLFIADL
jgi:glycosyltransferase involved in cell wall biosynthesis/ubiquinone/menaquinone biosynthesis C-methylase UbiE